MISTVTTSTISTMTIAGSMVIVGIIVLLAMLVQKELTSAKNARQKLQVWGQVIIIGIFPLLIAFLLVVITNISGVIR